MLQPSQKWDKQTEQHFLLMEEDYPYSMWQQ